ncbi:hypothetical protein ACN28S_49885 [Cystobacter fuscus]
MLINQDGVAVGIDEHEAHGASDAKTEGHDVRLFLTGMVVSCAVVLGAVGCTKRKQLEATETTQMPSVNYFFPLATITLPHRVDALTAFTSSSP